METESRQIVRKHWTYVLAYALVAALVVGFGVTGFLFLNLFLSGSSTRMPSHFIIQMWLTFGGIVSGVIFLIQLFAGPLIFTRDMVCRNCHRRQTIPRVPFFAGGKGGYKTPDCECGGDLEPALFWRTEP